LIISIGASMSVSSIGFNTSGFAPKARRIMVNIDPNDLEKSNYRPDLPIAADAGEFLEEFLSQFSGNEFAFSPEWKDACQKWKERYPTITPDYTSDNSVVNSYYFTQLLSERLNAGDVIVTGNSLDIVSVIHSFDIKGGQRVFTNINYGSMGWDLPGAVGACVGSKDHRTCLITGDGSIQFNIQEMMTIKANNLPVKIFVLNNDGYESIRSTQRNFFAGRFVGSDFKSGIANPDFKHLAAAYGFAYEFIKNNSGIVPKLDHILQLDGPVLCELKLSPDQPRSPKTMSARKEDGTFETRPLEDMFPFLSREEIYENMHLFDDGQ
jgi:acetolactate synthase I/II/III large subunit